LWIEDSFERLARHGFAPGIGLRVQARQSGVGFIVSPGGNELTVSRRGLVPLLSIEGRAVDVRMAGETVRVRASHNNIAVLPRAFALNFRGITADVRISGTAAIVNGKAIPLNAGRRVRLGGMGTLDFETSHDNVFWGCEVIAHHRPLCIIVSGSEKQVVAQYLLAVGYKSEDRLTFTR